MKMLADIGVEVFVAISPPRRLVRERKLLARLSLLTLLSHCKGCRTSCTLFITYRFTYDKLFMDVSLFA